MTHAWINFTLLAAGLCACAENFDRLATADQESRRPPSYRMRSCRNDVLFVDVPVNVHVPWNTTGFVSLVAADLAAAANAAGGAWFCGFAGCLGDPVEVGVRNVLLPQPGTPAAHDAHLRFFRFAFIAASGAWLTLREDSACVAVATLRSAFQARSGSGWDRTFYTGRECDALAMSLTSEPNTEMLAWHLEAIGLDAASLAIAAPAPGTSTVDLASIDTGVTPTVAAAIGVGDVGDFSWGGGLHVHGTGMSILARQISPTASISDLRALGGAGHGTSEHVARAVERAIFTNGPRPTVINLSLGWPAELGEPALLSGAGCTTHEDPFGEPVRYLLDVARRVDEIGTKPIFVTAAAGNRPLPVAPQLFPPAASGWVVPDCEPPPAGPQYFYPAEWDRVTTCRALDPTMRRVALAVSAITQSGDPSVLTISGGESALVAPGEQVVVAHSNAPAPPPSSCLAPQDPPEEPVLPAAFTGSSVSSALVAGAAARAQSIRVALGLLPLRADKLAALLYLTGVAVDRTTFNGTPIRRLNIPRLEQALYRPECEPVQNCGGGGWELISPTLLHDCRFALADCALETLDGSGNIIPNYPAVLKSPLVPPEDYVPDACFSVDVVADIFDESTCPGGICPDQTGVDRNLVGSLGPQPSGNGCPWCWLELRSALDGAMILELSAQFPATTTFTDPYLKVSGKDFTGLPKTYYVDLDAIVPPEEWVPGKTLQPEIDISPIMLNWETAQAELLMNIVQQGQILAVDVSPLLIHNL